ncbi:MAG: glycosyltransferase [Anaerolineaceae bacterium]
MIAAGQEKSKSGMQEAFLNYQKTRKEHCDANAQKMDGWKGLGGYYHDRLRQVYSFLVTPGQKVLEMGCGRGDLLASLAPSYGVGIDFSSGMISRAKARHPDLNFFEADVHEFHVKEKFDVIILSDLVNDLWDVQAVFDQVRLMSTDRTKIILNTYSHLWEAPLAVAEKLNLAKPTLYQNWLTVADIDNLFHLAGFEIVRSWSEIIWPFRTPLIDTFFNRFLARLWPFNQLALTNFAVARLLPEAAEKRKKPVVSVMVPARNEAGNIENIFARTPEMGAGTELVFVEGHSKDDTYEAIERAMKKHPERRAKLLRQPGIGKGDAVKFGFKESSGEILMILDADLTVPPEDLPRFYDALYSGKGDFINGVRLVYPMEKQAMRFLNFLGNKVFSLAFSWLLGQSVKDTLCGTKVLWKEDYEKISANRSYFGDFDPFGDFDLLFGAARLNMKIVDLPIRYRERTYGSTNIQRWSHGWLLLKMVSFAAGRIKFI